MILLSISIKAGSEEKSKIFLRLEMINGDMTYTTRQSEDGILTGVIYCQDKDSSMGVSSHLNDYFLKYFAHYNYLHENPNVVSDKKESMKYYENSAPLLFDRTIQFSIYPMKLKNNPDSLEIYCKYIFYKKVDKMDALNFRVDISYKESFTKVRINKEEPFHLWDEVFPKMSILALFGYENEKSKYAIGVLNFDEHKCHFYGKEFQQTVANSKLTNQNFNIGLEYIRSEKKNETILERKVGYPLTAYKKVFIKNSEEDLRISVYNGQISIPYYDPSAESDSSAVKNYENAIYTMIVVPESKEGDYYKFNTFFYYGFENRGTGSKKEIKIKIGEKIKIDLLGPNIFPGDLLRSGIKDRNELHKYIEESLIFSLEKSN
jgi:hypothetical protein